MLRFGGSHRWYTMVKLIYVLTTKDLPRCVSTPLLLDSDSRALYDRFVPATHPLRQFDNCLDFSFILPLVAERYHDEIGRFAKHPSRCSTCPSLTCPSTIPRRISATEARRLIRFCDPIQ